MSLKLSFENVSLSVVGKENAIRIFFPMNYALMIFIILQILMFCNFSHRILVLGTDEINKLKLVINEDGIHIVGTRNNFHVDYVTLQIKN